MFQKITNIMSYVIIVMVIILLLCGIFFLIKIGLAGGTGAFMILGLLILAFTVYGLAFYFRYKRFKRAEVYGDILTEEEKLKENQDIEE